MIKTICGKEVEITRKNNKNIIIKVVDGKIKMTVPYRSTISLAEAFFKSKQGWIESRLNSSVKSRIIGVDDGDIIYIFGEERRIKLLSEITKPYEEDGNLCVPDAINKCKILDKYLKEQLEKEAKKYFSYWEEKTGLKAEKVTIRKTDSRWGSCNHYTRRINLSFYLINLPKECLNYVVLHELGHIPYNNHGEKFKAFLTANMSKWRDIRRYMKENGESMKIKIKS